VRDVTESSSGRNLSDLAASSGLFSDRAAAKSTSD
jgi:hypothetical protein